MRLIVGLGNPGTQYAMTRHNAGFMALETLAQRHGLSGAKSKFHAGVIDGRIAGQKVLLMQPMTFMNRSGLAVGEAAAFYKVPPEHVLVLVDDVALPLGSVRLRAAGSAGGHNGLSDIERALGTRDYPRLRIGIDPPGRVPQVDWVLGRFTSDQADQLAPALDAAASAAEAWLVDPIDKVMSKHNG
jgi:PTH1 family peptidyl-tRNA hydrolase